MNIRENTLAVLHYEPYERLPILHFGYWAETLEKWAEEGHITWEEAKNWADGNAADLCPSDTVSPGKETGRGYTRGLLPTSAHAVPGRFHQTGCPAPADRRNGAGTDIRQ